MENTQHPTETKVRKDLPAPTESLRDAEVKVVETEPMHDVRIVDRGPQGMDF